jgi:hypothetical protein
MLASSHVLPPSSTPDSSSHVNHWNSTPEGFSHIPTNLSGSSAGRRSMSSGSRSFHFNILLCTLLRSKGAGSYALGLDAAMNRRIGKLEEDVSGLNV